MSTKTRNYDLYALARIIRAAHGNPQADGDDQALDAASAVQQWMRARGICRYDEREVEYSIAYPWEERTGVVTWENDDGETYDSYADACAELQGQGWCPSDVVVSRLAATPWRPVGFGEERHGGESVLTAPRWRDACGKVWEVDERDSGVLSRVLADGEVLSVSFAVAEGEWGPLEAVANPTGLSDVLNG